MSAKNPYRCSSLIAIHLLLISIAFPAFFLHPANFIFCNWGDGIKNYFTLYSYVKEPIGADGIFKFHSFFYPFGDYVYYTDNTPFFSIPFRWFCQHVHDISSYAIPAFNTFIISNILFSSLLVFYIFRRFTGTNVFSYSLAVLLPWVNVQLPRIWAGDFNLSVTCVVLAAIALFISWYDNRASIKRQILPAAGMMLLLFASFLVHGYYLAIIPVFLVALLCSVAIFSKEKNKKAVVITTMMLLLTMAAIVGILQLTDKYLDLRKANAMGYDDPGQKTNFLLLFTHYDFHSLGFPVATTMPAMLESMVYLGNIGLFSFAAIFIGSVFSTGFRQRVLDIQKEFFSDELKKSIFMAGLLMLIISFGEWYATNRDELKIYTPIPALNNVSTNILLVSIALLSLAVYGIVLAVNHKAREQLKKIKKSYVLHPYKKIGFLLCTGALAYLFIARYSVTFPNILNPFFYLHFVSKRVEQFRCLSRFLWPFFWTFYIWVMYTVVRLYQQSGASAKKIIVILFLVIGAIEVTDYVREMRKMAGSENIYASKSLQKFSNLKIDFSAYQVSCQYLITQSVRKTTPIQLTIMTTGVNTPCSCRYSVICH